MSKKVQDFVQQVNQQNFSAAKGSFESAIAEKINSFFENKKIDLASQMTEEMQTKKKLKESKNLPSWLVNQYERRAEYERRDGGSIEINRVLPYVAVEMSDGSEYFFQGEEADDLLDTVPNNINEEDFLLAIAQNW